MASHAITRAVLIEPRGIEWGCACGTSGRCPRPVAAQVLADHLAMPAGEEPQRLLDLPLPPNDSGAATVRGYLTELLVIAWESGSALHPFGNSGWQHDLYEPMTRAGLAAIGYDEAGYATGSNAGYAEADQLILAAIRELGDARG